ncbi:MAG TPA: hypothetical protein VLU41_07285, partial [Ideonella sp.]|nr:hypothetical protein [Ideonella sp.]
MLERGLQRGLRLGQAHLDRSELLLMTFLRLAQGFEAGFLLRDHGLVRPFDAARFTRQAPAALVQRIDRAYGARAVGLLDAQLLLGLREFAPRRGNRGIGSLPGGLRLGQALANLGMARLGLLGAHRRIVEQTGPALALRRQRRLALLPVCLVGRELREPRLQPLARVVEVAQFGFQPRHFRRHRKEIRLRGVRGLGCLEVPRTRLLDGVLELLQAGAVGLHLRRQLIE